jgi:thymidylate synthase
LYSNDGVNPLLRNILAQPRIRTIIICGQDRIGSADALINLAANGVDEHHAVIGTPESRVDKEIPREAIDAFRTHVEILDMRGVMKSDEIARVAAECDQRTDLWRDPALYPEAEITSDWFPSEHSGFSYRGATVADVWPKILHGIMRFGELKKSNHTSGKQRELLNVSAVITNEDPDDIKHADYFNFTPSHFKEYTKQVLTADPIESLSYTYGMRLRDHNSVNQVHEIIEKLKKEPWTRQAVASLWDVSRDHHSSHPPCLTIVHALLKYDKLFLVCYLRSNDVFRAWPENALAFRLLQKEIADGVGVGLGHLTTIADSAHVYEENFVRAQEIIETAYPDLPCEQDPRGNFVIRVIPETHIEVLHLTPQGKKIGRYSGKTAMSLMNQIARDEGISVAIHAMDVGAELQKAELAFKHGLDYTQDRPLNIATSQS